MHEETDSKIRSLREFPISFSHVPVGVILRRRWFGRVEIPRNAMEGVVPTMPPRHLPNVLITGTPGVGKTTLARSVVEMLASEHALTHVDVTALCLEKNLTDGFDSEVRFVSAERPRRLNRRAARCSAAAACCVAVAAVLNRRSFGLQKVSLGSSVSLSKSCSAIRQSSTRTKFATNSRSPCVEAASLPTITRPSSSRSVGST